MLAFLVMACQEDSAQPTLNAEWTEVRVIGADESEPESLLGLPRNMVLHPDGLLFVHDMQQQRVQVYETDGTYVGAIGQEGEGPGEFTRIGTLGLAVNGDLVVYDEVQRRVTRFDTDGNVLDQTQFDSWFSTLLPEGSGFLIAGRSQTAGPEHGYFRTVDANFEATGYEFGPLGDVIDTDDPVAYSSIRGPVMFSRDGERIYWAPYFYDGVIRVFQRGDDEWEAPEPLRGRTIEPAYQTLTGSEAENNPDRVYFMTLTEDGEIGVEVFSWSLGLIEQEDGRLAHFFCYEEGDERILAVEVFESDGTYRGTAELQRFDIDEQLGPHLRVEAQDEAGRFYVRDMASATIRAFELTLTE